MPGLEKEPSKNNELGTKNRRVSITVKSKKNIENNNFSDTPLIHSETDNIKKDTLERDTIKVETLESNITLQNNSRKNNNSSIFGMVTDIRGLPIGDAVVQLKSLERDSSSVIDEVHTNNRGEYLFGKLSSGLYSINIYKNGFIPYKSSNISIVLDENIGMNFQLQEDLRNHLGSIHGIITDEASGDPLNNILVALYSLINNSEHLVSSTFTNRDGHYAFSLIPPGRYIIKAGAGRKEEA